MGACASFPKGLKKEDREAPAPEQPKEEVSPVEVAEVEKEIKVDDKAKEEDDKTLGMLMKEGEVKETKTIMALEVKEAEIEKDSPAIVEAKAEMPHPVKEEKAESYNAPVATVTIDDNKEITEIKEDKK